MILSSFWYHSGILGFLHVKFIADFRMMVMACSGHQFSLCRWFAYRTIILPTMDIPMVHKTPLGTSMGCACLSGQHGVWFLVVAGVSWGCAKSVVNLANFSPCQC